MMNSKFAAPCFSWMLSLFVVAAMIFWTAAAAQGAIQECLEATCRITTGDGSCGSGCVFNVSNEQVYILTAAHVVGQASAAQCEFWRQGHQSRPLAAQVIGRSAAVDTAFLTVPVASFAGAVPPAVPLAPADFVARPGDTLYSVGCANGTWATAWEGHALRYEDDSLRFVPVPANGRSGSAMFDAEGRQIVGIVRARTGDNTEGLANTVQMIYAAMQGADRSSESRSAVGPDAAWFAQPTQCGPGGCCPTQPPPSQNHLLPFRNRREQQNPSPYPTLPSAPPMDLKPLDEKLGKIADLLLEMRGRSGGATDRLGEGATEGQIRRAAMEALETARTAQAETARLAQITDKLHQDQQRTNEAIQRHGTLGERIEMLRQRVDERVGDDSSRPEKLRALIHEAVTDKTEWMRIGMIAALVLPLVIFVIDIAHHKKSGDPLLIEKLAAQLAAGALHQPWLVPAANVASHAVHDVTGLLALLNQQTQASAQKPPSTVVVAPQHPATPAAGTPPAATPAAT